MKIAIGTDHRGFAHKEFIKNHHALAGYSITWMDVGTHSTERTDYPLFAQKVCSLMKHGKVERAVLLCGSGIGMAVAANRYQYIYAAVVWNKHVAAAAAADDKINVLVIPTEFVTHEEAVTMIGVWLSTPFKGGRYQQRIEQVDALGGITTQEA